MARTRSWLYVPGHRQGWIAKARSSGADVVIADLEDGVPPDAKDAAVALVLDVLTGAREGVPVWVRVDPSRLDDVTAVADAGAVGIVLPKSGHGAGR